MPLSHTDRQTIHQGRLFVCVWSAASPGNTHQSAAVAYANAIGKPVRVLVTKGVRLPENAFLGVTDLEIAHVDTPEAGAAQLMAWMEALT